MNAFELVAVILGGYLVGSIPFAVIVAKHYGINIFHVGSRNAGATNVKRSVGKNAGNLVFLLDMLKGVVAAGWPLIPALDASDPLVLGAFGLVAAVLGHAFSIFIDFRGGKGVSTTIGGMFMLMTGPMLIGVIIWVITFYASRYVSLASILLGLSLPISAFFMNLPMFLFWFSVFIALFIILRHRSNIYRLIHGKENRFPSKRDFE